MGYAEVYARWKADPEGFWMAAAKAIDWTRPPSRAYFADNGPVGEWYADGMTNTCCNPVHRHDA